MTEIEIYEILYKIIFPSFFIGFLIVIIYLQIIKIKAVQELKERYESEENEFIKKANLNFETMLNENRKLSEEVNQNLKKNFNIIDLKISEFLNELDKVALEEQQITYLMKEMRIKDAIIHKKTKQIKRLKDEK